MSKRVGVGVVPRNVRDGGFANGTDGGFAERQTQNAQRVAGSG
jgi:hypothetical protein